MLLKFVEKEEKVPSGKQEFKGMKIGTYWKNYKQNKGPTDALFMSTFSTNTFLRDDMERYTQNRSTGE